MNTEKTSLENENEPSCLGAVISRFSLDERVYSLRHEKYGTVKSVDSDKGYVIAFSKDKYDYEYHYPNEVSKNGL